MFETSILADPPKAQKRSTLFISFLAQIAVCGVLLLIPLVYTDAITIFPDFAPPVIGPVLTRHEPPPDVKPSPTKAQPSRGPSRTFRPPVLTAPPSIPTIVAVIVDAPTGVPDVPTGIPQSGIVGPAVVFPPNDLPRPPEPAPKAAVIEPPVQQTPPVPVRISGGVQEAKLTKRVVPPYPAPASRARIQGTVRLRAIIGRDGKVRDLTVVEGHPFLRQAAVDAVRQWEYSPTILGTEPVEVETTVDVNFVLR